MLRSIKYVPIAIASGWDHYLVLTDQGDVLGWGGNDHCQLNTGPPKEFLSPIKLMSDIQAIAAGSYYSLALSKRGNLLTWGRNDWGQLGDGSQQDRATPMKIR
jgi:alpha-tubulin suppressor-like RCC1 family protein